MKREALAWLSHHEKEEAIKHEKGTIGVGVRQCAPDVYQD